jgi:hypothetical protein
MEFCADNHSIGLIHYRAEHTNEPFQFQVRFWVMSFEFFKRPSLDALARYYGTDKSSKKHNFANF